MNHLPKLLVVAGLLLPTGAIAQIGTWTRTAALTTTPTSVDTHSMAFDSARGEIVLYSQGLTWTYDGSDWTLALGASAPPALVGFASAFDATRNTMVVFGGQDALGNYVDETWEWDGRDWARVPTPSGPSGRIGATLTADTQGGVLILFGGQDASGAVLGDTWEFRNGVWQQLSPAQSPSPRTGHSAVEIAAQRIVLAGGLIPSTLPGPLMSDETWEWDGSNWQLIPTGTLPGARAIAAAGFDISRGAAVIHGGQLSRRVNANIILATRYDDTLEYDPVARAWTVVSTEGQPDGTIVQSMVLNPFRIGLLRVSQGLGGVVGWDWQRIQPSEARFTSFGQSCLALSAAGDLSLETLAGSRPRLGSIFQARVRNVPPSASFVLLVYGTSNSSWLGQSLPLTTTQFRIAIGCEVWVRPEEGLLLPIVGDNADYTVNVPANPNLLGTTLYYQALALTPSNRRTSNAATLVVGN